MLSNLKNKIYYLLRRSEKYTKTDMVYLAKGGFWLTINQVISVLSALLLSIALANLLPKEVYGQYKYILSIFGVLTIATMPGIDSAVVRAIAQGNEGSFYAALKTKIKWGILGGIISLFIAIYYYINQNFQLSGAFAIVAFCLPFTDTTALFQSYFSGKKMFNKLTKYMSTMKIISAIVIIITIYLSDSLFWVLLAFFVPYIIVRTIYIYVIKNRYTLNKEVDKQTVSYGKHLSAISILGTVAMQIDKILIFHYIGAAELAVYSFAIAPLEQMKSLIKPLQTLSMPKFATQDKQTIQKTLIKKIAKLSLLLAFVAMVYILLAPYLYKILFPQYLDSVFYSRIFAISFVTLPLLAILSAFEAQKMIKEIYSFKITSGVSQILVTFFLIINFGLLGAVLSRVIARFINMFLAIFLLKRSKD